MKQHLNTLFVTTQGAYLRKDGQTVAVRIEKETRLRVANVTEPDSLRGVEGDAATLYFSAFNSMINVPAKEFVYTKRSRRPPLDPLNALLSFAYTMLSHDVRSACEATSLDSQLGFLHRDRPGRPGMALDLMEEFRPFLADRMVRSLINRQQIQAKDFTQRESGAVFLSDAGRKVFLTSWQQRKQEIITHPFLNEKTTVGLLMHLQARLMARYLRNDLDTYPPFIWK